MRKVRFGIAVWSALLGFAHDANALSLPEGWEGNADDAYSISDYFGSDLNIEYARGFASNSDRSPLIPLAGVYIFKPNGELIDVKQCSEAVVQLLRKRDKSSRKAWSIGTGVSQVDAFPKNVFAYSFDRSPSLFSEGLSFRLLMKVDANNKVTEYCFVVFQPSAIEKLESSLFTLLNNNWLNAANQTEGQKAPDDGAGKK